MHTLYPIPYALGQGPLDTTYAFAAVRDPALKYRKGLNCLAMATVCTRQHAGDVSICEQATGEG